MPRKTAAERHADSAPVRSTAAGSGNELVDVLVAFHHPTRRWLGELLSVEGPASVGMLAAKTGLAVGSVSHHLKALHRHGFIEPAPELANDTRESWWRSSERHLTWSADDYAPGSPDRRIADSAEGENFRHQVRAMRQWLSADRSEDPWREHASSTDTLCSATQPQLADLSARLKDVITAWSSECLADAEQRPDVERRPVRVIARAFPSGPVRP